MTIGIPGSTFDHPAELKKPCRLNEYTPCDTPPLPYLYWRMNASLIHHSSKQVATAEPNIIAISPRLRSRSTQ